MSIITRRSGYSYFPELSDDGRFILFYSEARDLVPGDTNNAVDVFRWDAQTDTIVRVSVATGGSQGNRGAGGGAISGDGRFITFESGSSNLVAGDANGKSDVFLRDMQTGTTTLVSVASDGTQGNGSPSDSATISDDGRFVLFSSDADNLVAGDTNGQADFFLRDTQTGTTTRISTAADGSQGNGASFWGEISGDGRFAVFQSRATNLVAGDANGRDDIFVKNLQTGAVTLVSSAADGTAGNGGAVTSSISADGRFVVFTSISSNLVTGDTNGFNDIFLRDLQAGTIARISVATDGTQANSGSYGPSISDDGRFVVFTSTATNLGSGGGSIGSGLYGAYLHDTLTGATTLLSVGRDGAIGNDNLYGATISGDGRFVTFSHSAVNLVADDSASSSNDTYTDVFRISLIQSDGEDVLVADAAGGTIEGGGGNDFLKGLTGDDTFDGGAGDDLFEGGAGADQLAGGDGLDTASYVNATGDVTVDITTGLTDGSEALGDILTNIENLTGGSGNDLLRGDSGANRLSGRGGNDGLEGAGGDDVLDGSSGGDMLDGGDGADLLRGGAADDFVEGGAGADRLDGGDGVDTASYAGASGGVNVDLAAGRGIAFEADGDVLIAIEILAGGDGNDWLRGNDSVENQSDGANKLSGGLGDDTLEGRNGDDTLNGLNGDDVLLGGGGFDTLSGGNGHDWLKGGGNGDTLTGGAGADAFVFTFFQDSFAEDPDKITDFRQTDGDRIGLAGIDADTSQAGNQAFSFIGTAAFTGQAGQLRYGIAGQQTSVSGDINGDGIMDFQIILSGAIQLTAVDFQL